MLVHPYPQAVAGTPRSVSWDPAGRVLRFTYTARPATGATDVFVPARSYPDGYVVTATGGRVRRGGDPAHVLVDARRAGTEVTVVVRPAGG